MDHLEPASERKLPYHSGNTLMDTTLPMDSSDNARAANHAAALPPARRVASWLILITALVIILILWGGLVRLSGSGLSIPEWPIINGSLLPPMTAEGWNTVYHTYYREILGISDPATAGGMEMGTFQRMFAIEYIHRFLAALVGIVFLAIFIRAARLRTVWPRIKSLLITSAIVLVAQGVLGGLVVKLDLRAEAVAIHLGTAFFFLSLLLWAALRLFRADQVPATAGNRLYRLSWITTALAFLQVVSGGLVAGTGAGLMLNTWPKMGSYWIPPAHTLWADWYGGLSNLVQNQILIQFIHRWLAFVVLVHVALLIARGMKSVVPPRARVALRAVATVTALQILLGIGNLVMHVPFAMAYAHLTTGLILFVLLVVITHESAYVPRAETA